MINVCVSCDENYSKYAGVLIASILANASSDDNLSFYILTDGLSDLRKSELLKLKDIKNCNINFVQIDKELFKDYENIKSHAYIPLCGFYRLKLASILPDVNRIIYLDCDIIVKRSLAELFNADLEQNVAGGVLDINQRMLKKNPTYVNSGVLVMDLQKIREQGIEQEFLNWTKEHVDTIKMGDQEIINEVLKNRIKILDNRWNVQSSNFSNRSSYTSNPYIIHFVARRKPWHFASFSYHRKYYFDYLQLTPWALSEKEKYYWYYWNQVVSLIKYAIRRPLFFLRPCFYKAFFYTYIKPD